MTTEPWLPDSNKRGFFMATRVPNFESLSWCQVTTLGPLSICKTNKKVFYPNIYKNQQIAVLRSILFSSFLEGWEHIQNVFFSMASKTKFPWLKRIIAWQPQAPHEVTDNLDVYRIDIGTFLVVRLEISHSNFGTWKQAPDQCLKSRRVITKHP